MSDKVPHVGLAQSRAPVWCSILGPFFEHSPQRDIPITVLTLPSFGGAPGETLGSSSFWYLLLLLPTFDLVYHKDRVMELPFLTCFCWELVGCAHLLADLGQLESVHLVL